MRNYKHYFVTSINCTTLCTLEGMRLVPGNRPGPAQVGDARSGLGA
jgi:hypothetical protein